MPSHKNTIKEKKHITRSKRVTPNPCNNKNTLWKEKKKI